MEIQPNQTDAVTALTQSGERAVAETDQAANSHDARLSRVLDYQASSLEKDDPLEANLGSINSGLMRVALSSHLARRTSGLQPVYVGFSAS